MQDSTYVCGEQILKNAFKFALYTHTVILVTDLWVCDGVVVSALDKMGTQRHTAGVNPANWTRIPSRGE